MTRAEARATGLTFCALEEIMTNSAPGGANGFNTKIIEEFRANDQRARYRAL